MKRFVLTIFLLGSMISFAQQALPSWSVQPFTGLGFTEDLGRNTGIIDEDIKYFVQSAGYHIFILPNAFVFAKPQDLSKEEAHERIEKLEHGKPVEPIKWDYFKVEFQNSNPESQIIPTSIKQHTRNFQGNQGTIKAKSYGKLTYKNLYPNIDMVLELPEAGGLKYTFHIHPGGDYKNIEMLYPEVNTILGPDGNLAIDHSTIPAIDQAPTSFVAGEEIFSEFIKEGKTIGFFVDDYDQSNELIIDPWYVLGLPGAAAGYEVAADNFNHCTVVASMPISRELLMYDDAGILVWTWEIPFNYPDISMNPATGETYVFGFAPNKVMSRIDSLGSLTAQFEEFEFNEAWRVKYSEFHNAVFGAGGGFFGDDSHVDLYDLDLLTHTEHISFSDLMDEQEDCALFEVDPVDGSLYYVPSGWADEDGMFGNHLYKLDAADPTSIVWSSYTNHGFMHGSNNATYASLNGVNGIACGTNFVFTYDGEKIIKYDRMSGVRADSLFLGTEQYSQYGLDIDACNNLYVGSYESVFVYSEDFVLIETYPLPGPCYDLQVINGGLYVSGETFAMKHDIPEILDYLITPFTTVCGDCSGSASFDVLSCGEYSPETIVWEPGGAIGPTISDLCAGWYTVTSTWIDPYGSEIIMVDSIEIISINEPLTVEYETTPVSCFGLCDGALSLVALSGISPYEFLVDDETNASGLFTDLCADSYEVLVTDDRGCYFDMLIEIEEPDELVGLITEHIDILCFGEDSGSVQINAEGGTGPYTYNIGEGPVDEGEFTGLAPGSYVVTILDDNGCSVDVPVEILDAAELTLNEVYVIDILCNGENTGEIEVVGTGGTGSYEYSIDAVIFDVVALFEDLVAGDYTLTVHDANYCESTLDLTITEPEPIVIDEASTQEICEGDCNGTITLGASGGVGSFSFSLDDCLSVTPTGVFIDLCPNDYNICIEDENGCRYTNTITIDPGLSPANPTINPIGPFCMGDDPELIMTAELGELTGPGVLGDTFDPSLAGPGIHTITNTISDSCGGAIASLEVIVHPEVEVNFTVNENVGCVPVQVVFSNIGETGVSCEWDFGDGFTIETCDWVMHDYITPGVYDVSLTVVNAFGCSATITYFDYIEANAIPVADFVYAPTSVTTLDPMVEFTDRSSGADFWNWAFGEVGNSADQNPTFLFPDKQGNYDVTQIAISLQGCRDTISKTLVVTQKHLIFVPNIITPDGNSFNEVFKPHFTGIDIYDYHLSIYNRWGEVIFESFNVEQGWNGTYAGEIVQDGVYVWHIQASDIESDKRREYQGHVTVAK